MSRFLYAGIALLTLAGGTVLWWAARPSNPGTAPPQITPAAMWSATFTDVHGARHALGEFQGHVVVLNFWATWCAPCREEMPAFSRLHASWREHGVRFIGLANDDPRKVERFAHDFAIAYPLWVGGEEIGELSRRLGNRLGVLPHTVILGPDGTVVDARVGPYTQSDLEAKLRALVGKGA